MADILQVGALIDLSQILPGLEKLAATTSTATGTMNASFTTLGASSAAGARTAAANIEIIPVALVSAEVEAVKAEGLFASTLSRIGVFFTELAASARGAAASVVASMHGMEERVVASAEKSGLEVGAMSTAFSGFSKLLGVGLAVGFAAHFLDESATVIVELKHLETQTHINIQTLAGLRAIA